MWRSATITFPLFEQAPQYTGTPTGSMRCGADRTVKSRQHVPTVGVVSVVLLLFFQLLIGHAVADFVMQSDTMARAKLRHGDLRATYGPSFPPWYYWLSAHALVHAGAVYLLTGSALLGAIEAVLHWVIDFAKSERWITFHQDQALHVLCKAAYCSLIYAAPGVF
jgi:Protein of unknown function (DUF3307)